MSFSCTGRLQALSIFVWAALSPCLWAKEGCPGHLAALVASHPKAEQLRFLPGREKTNFAQPRKIEKIGNTPLVTLIPGGVVAPAGIFGKCEFCNPGGSSKDRIALAMIEALERSGELHAPGLIVEASSGNTGIGLAWIGKSKGHEVLIIAHDQNGPEKIELLRERGAHVVLFPYGQSMESPLSYSGLTAHFRSKLSKAAFPNQHANPINPQTHFKTMGSEIWNQMDGKLDAVVGAEDYPVRSYRREQPDEYGRSQGEIEMSRFRIPRIAAFPFPKPHTGP